MEWLRSIDCPWDEVMFKIAAEYDDLALLE
jgi:hypothetical protein